jgi:two-component system response regulator HydG
MKMLVVDDEHGVRDALARWFTMSGFDVDEAEDGEVAVAKCMDQAYDIIITDLIMPRMDGIEAIRRIKMNQPEVPILVMSAFHEDMDAAIDVGADRILTKPLSLSSLESQVHDVLASRDGSGECATS